MNATDRAEFLEAIAGLDKSVDFITIEAGKDDTTYDTQTAPLVGQIGNLAKAVMLLTNLILELNQPQPQPAPQAEQCSFCTRPANPDLATADWPMCSSCFNAMAAPAGDDTWRELLADVLGGER